MFQRTREKKEIKQVYVPTLLTLRIKVNRVNKVNRMNLDVQVNRNRIRLLYQVSMEILIQSTS